MKHDDASAEECGGGGVAKRQASETAPGPRPEACDAGPLPSTLSPLPSDSLDLTWRILLHLIHHNFERQTDAQISEALSVARTTIGRAVERLVAAGAIEVCDDGTYAPGLIFAQAYAHRLHQLNSRLERTRMVIQSIGAELMILHGDVPDVRGQESGARRLKDRDQVGGNCDARG